MDSDTYSYWMQDLQDMLLRVNMKNCKCMCLECNDCTLLFVPFTALKATPPTVSHIYVDAYHCNSKGTLEYIPMYIHRHILNISTSNNYFFSSSANGDIKTIYER